MHKILFRRANKQDLYSIVALLSDDELGKDREHISDNLSERYSKAFSDINRDSNQYLVVGELDGEVVATCHLTVMPSLTFHGSKRMQIEAVRVSAHHRGHNIGREMIEHAISYAKDNDVEIVQLSTNKKRVVALKFYESIGFKNTHEGMKLYL